MRRIRVNGLVLTAALGGLACSPSAQDSLPAETRVTLEGLGTTSFPTSGSPAAQGAFIRGVLLLHSFEYVDALAAFKQAQALDPDFAMAYWGEAMTYNHPAWNEQDRESALAALERFANTPGARAERAPSPRERGWIEAVDVLYGDGPKARRDTLYSEAMRDLAEQYPNDYEAQAFLALSLIGLSQGSRDIATYMRAGALALDLFAENPEHPGAAHYVIHSFDDPIHAPLGLNAARRYSEIAPDAAHAQHMTSHIFLALGMWDDIAVANRRSAAVMNRARAESDLPPMRCGHFGEWLFYANQQLGRHDEVLAILRGCHEDATHPELSDAVVDWSSRLSGPTAAPAVLAGRSFARMRALFFSDPTLVSANPETADFIRTATVPAAEASAAYLSLMDIGSALADANSGQLDSARLVLGRFRERGAPDAPFVARYLSVWESTIRSLIAAQEGDMERALASAHAAIEEEDGLPIDYGPPLSFKPPRELEGDLLLTLGDFEGAIRAYGAALARTPQRRLSLLGRSVARERGLRPD